MVFGNGIAPFRFLTPFLKADLKSYDITGKKMLPLPLDSGLEVWLKKVRKVAMMKVDKGRERT
jgi:hypothetical protein